MKSKKGKGKNERNLGWDDGEDEMGFLLFLTKERRVGGKKGKGRKRGAMLKALKEEKHTKDINKVC